MLSNFVKVMPKTRVARYLTHIVHSAYVHRDSKKVITEDHSRPITRCYTTLKHYGRGIVFLVHSNNAFYAEYALYINRTLIHKLEACK